MTISVNKIAKNLNSVFLHGVYIIIIDDAIIKRIRPMPNTENLKCKLYTRYLYQEHTHFVT